MKLKFEPSDFMIYDMRKGNDIITVRAVVNIANAKLDRYLKEHGKVVYGYSNVAEGGTVWHAIGAPERLFKHTAILINIEEIQKCEHPKEKVKEDVPVGTWTAIFTCECGARVEPSGFRGVE